MPQPVTDRRVLIKRTARIVLIGVAVVLLLMVAGGIYGIARQWRVDHTYQAVPAKITLARIRTISSNGFLYYQPNLTYQYAVAGKLYTAHAIHGHQRVGTRPWAAAILHHYPPGAEVQAWYDPAHPHTVLLVRPFSFAFYLMVLVPVMIALVVAWAWRTVLAPLAGPILNMNPQPTADGWFVLQPRHTIGGQIKFWILVLLTWLAAMALAFGQYFVMAGRHYQSLAVAGLVVGVLFALVPLAMSLRWLWIFGRLLEPVITINKARPKMGQTVEVRVAQRFRRNLPVEQIVLEMSCHRQALFVSDLLRSGSQLVEDIPWLSAQSLVASTMATVENPLAGSAAYELPASLEPIPKFKIRPARIMLRWQGRLSVVAGGRRIHQAIYPFTVEFSAPRPTAVAVET